MRRIATHWMCVLASALCFSVEPDTANFAHAADSGLIAEYVGYYACAQGNTSLILDITEVKDASLPNAIFRFGPVEKNAELPSGAFLLRGTIDLSGGKLDLHPVSWLSRPPGYTMVGLLGKSNDRGETFEGSVLFASGCSNFSVHRTILSVDSDASSGGVPKEPPVGTAPARAQPINTESQQTTISRETVLAVCHGRLSAAWFGNVMGGISSKILTLDQAVKVRLDALRTRNDRLTLEIVNFQRLLDASQAARSRNSSIPSSDEECAQTYIALLKSFDAPSWEIARKEAAQSSAANIEQQRQMREAQQRASDEVAAEQARQQKEAKDAAAQADSERRQRAAAAEQARNEALLADMRDKAERGDGESQYEMGTYYDTKHVMNVLGTSAPPKNDKQAADWYTKAAAQGHLPSRVMLCHMYYDGRGVPEDHTKAESFCGNSSQQDQDILEYRFKDLLQKAEEGDTKAQGEVGVRYYEGNAIPGRDFAKAVYWIQKAADKGDPVAQQNLGIMYLNGFGVPHDSARALTWYRKAANQDFAVAQSNLGFIYLNGTGGTPKDVAEAANWLEKAAKLGLPLPQEAVAELYEEGRGVPQDDAKAEDWYLKAAQQGNENAKYRYEALRKVMLYKRYIKSINDTFMTPKDASDICVLGAKFQDRKIVMANELVAMLAQDDAVVRIDFSTPGLFSRSYKIDVVYITTKPGQLKTIFLREVMVDRPTGEVYKNPAEAAQATDVQKCLAITKIEGVNREDTLIGNDLQAAVAAQVIVSQLGARLFARAQSADQ